MTKRYLDFSVDHRLMRVEPSIKMQTIASQLLVLQERYRLLEEAEQKRQWREYVRLVRNNAVRRFERSLIQGTQKW